MVYHTFRDIPNTKTNISATNEDIRGLGVSTKEQSNSFQLRDEE